MNGLTANTTAPLNPLQTGNGTNKGGGTTRKGINTPPQGLLGHYSQLPVDANMATYNEVREYILRQVRRENAFLHMSTVRLEHSVAILQTLPPVPENMRWLCIVDWCLNDIANAQAQIELWRHRLECVRAADLLVECMMVDWND